MHRITRARVQRYFPLLFRVVNIEEKKRKKKHEKPLRQKKKEKGRREKKGGTIFRRKSRLDRITSITPNWAGIPKNDMWT